MLFLLLLHLAYRCIRFITLPRIQKCMHKPLGNRESQIQKLILSMGKCLHAEGLQRTLCRLGHTQLSLCMIEMKGIPNEKREGPTLAKARGDAHGAERPREGLTILGQRKAVLATSQAAIFSLCFEQLTQTGKKGLFSHLESFQNTKRIKSRGKYTHSSQIFFNGQNKQTNKNKQQKINRRSAWGNAWRHWGSRHLFISSGQQLSATAAATLRKDIFPFSWRVAKTSRESKWQNIWLHSSLLALFTPVPCKHLPDLPDFSSTSCLAAQAQVWSLIFHKSEGAETLTFK